jgi:Anti-sigma-K factor rskA, C-terminal
MSARDHSVIEELLAVRALGGLDTDDEIRLQRLMAEHGPDCEECRRLQDEFDETAGLLGFALDPVPVDPRIADRILAQPRPTPVREQPTQRRGRRWPALVAVAAAVILVLASIAVFRPRTQTIAGVSFGQQVITFEGGTGEVAMAYSPGEPGALIVGRDLPAPGADRTYEIWAITGTSPVSAGCVSPTDGRLATFTNLDVSTSDLMAITVEAQSCPSAPTTQPVYTATLA